MKLFGENRDRAIDTLLRAQVSRRSRVSQTCPEFDPDLANAYVESRLTAGLHLRYEEHLSVCATCRKSVVGLSRIAMSDLKPARTSGVKVRAVFGVLSRPQWALAAAAIIVFVVSLPLLLSRSPNQTTERASSSVAEPPAFDAAPTAALSAQEKPSQAHVAASAKPNEERNDKNAAASSKKVQASTTTGSQEKREARSEGQSTDELKQKSETQSASQVAAAAAPESQETKSDSERGRQQQKDSAQGGESRGRADEASGKETVQVVAEAATPAPPPAPRGRLVKPPARKLSLRDNATSESVRPSERKIHNKSFLWKDGAWTDKKFDPDKGLPVVTIIRASNVYNEVLNKHAGLRRYLDGLPQTERAIIVYEGTVYKLIPQQN